MNTDPWTPAAWLPHPVLMAAWLALVAAYALSGGPLRRRFAGAAPVPYAQVLAFAAGAAALLAAVAGPLPVLADHYLFSAHMVRHLLLTLVAPPLLWAGTPAWMLRPLLRPRWALAVARIATFAPVALGLSGLIFFVEHFPAPFAFAARGPGTHLGVQVLTFVAGLLLWAPVMSPLPELPRIPAPVQMVYLFIAGVPMMSSALRITFAGEVLYPLYAAAPRVAGISVLNDQRIGGLIMSVPGGLWIWAGIAFVYFRWTRGEARTDAERLATVRPSSSPPAAPAPRA